MPVRGDRADLADIAGSGSSSRSGRTGAPAHRGHPEPGSCRMGTGAAAGSAHFCGGPTHEVGSTRYLKGLSQPKRFYG